MFHGRGALFGFCAETGEVLGVCSRLPNDNPGWFSVI